MIGNGEGAAASMGNMGLTYKIKGDIEEALKHFKDALLLMDCLLDNLPLNLLLENNQDAFLDHGFEEIWLADCTRLEQFSKILDKA